MGSGEDALWETMEVSKENVEIEAMASWLHEKWQDDFRRDNNHPDRFKPVKSAEWITQKTEQCAVSGTVVLNRGTNKESTVKVSLTPDRKVAVSDDGSVYIDILNTDYVELSDDWQADNKLAAGSSIQVVRGLSGNYDDQSIENASSQFHDIFLQRRKAAGAYIDPDQDKPYANLSDIEKEKDRVFIRKAIQVVSDVS